MLLFLAQGFEDLEAITIVDVCGWTQYREHLPTVRVTTAGFHDEVRGRFGTTIRPDLHIRDVTPSSFAALALPGGFFSYGFDEAFHPLVYEVVKSIHANGGTLATMCVGVLPVAEAGLLKGKKATTYPFSRNHDNLGRLRKLGCTATAGPIEVSERIISCAGPAQSLEVASLLLENLIGREAAKEARRYWEGRDDEHRDQAR